MVEPTDSEDNASGEKNVSHESDDKPIELEEHAKGFRDSLSESLVKDGENIDGKALNLSSENGGGIVEESHECVVSDTEWVCKSPNDDSTSSGWPSFNPKSSSQAYILSEEEKATVAVLHLQHKALEACREYLVGNAGSDCEEEDNDDEDESVENYDSAKNEEYNFFERVFLEDDQLRRYYENNYRKGDFYCLVCGAIGKKVWKRFKDCAALIHHSTSILKTEKMRAHRAYAQVICKVVGWDIDQLPAIVLKDSDSSLVTSRKLLVEKALDPNSENGGVEASHEYVVSNTEWVCGSVNDDFSSSGWRSFNTKSSSHTYTLSAEEQATVAILHLQHKALEACREYLVGNAGSDCDEDDNDDVDELVDNFDSEKSEEYKFFEKVFTEDEELRRYYENNYRKGDFYCLVCGGIGKKVWKRFKDCATLINHSTSILKTEKKRAHRAYALVIRKVVGWDVDQMPVIVLKDSNSSLEASRKLSVEKTSDLNSEKGGGVEASQESVVSNTEWVCKSPNDDFSSSGWPSFNTKSSSDTYTLSAEEQATVAVLHLQHKALEASQQFLVGNAGSDCDEYDNDDEDELVDNYDSDKSKEYKFFEKVFAEDDELRRYYENNYRKGDFYCLVCGGIGKKVWKRFKDCIALIQHSTAILKTEKMRAHRAYAQVICKVVGWDIDQLPAIVLKDSDSSLVTSMKLLVEPGKVAADSIDTNDEADNPAESHTA